MDHHETLDATDEAVRMVREMHVHLHPLEIAQRTGVSVRQVYRWLGGMPPRMALVRRSIQAAYAQMQDSLQGAVVQPSV